jgi:hypothetical protein
MFSRRRVGGKKLQGSEPLRDLTERPGVGLPRDISLGVHEKGERHFWGVHENGGAPGGLSGFFKILCEEIFFGDIRPSRGAVKTAVAAHVCFRYTPILIRAGRLRIRVMN